MPTEPYNGTYGGQYTTFPNVCPYQSYLTSTGNQSEDCLYLNIFAPPNAQGLPVKAWVYGGGNEGGSINYHEYNGCHLADAGAVVVLIAYRVGPWGFLAIEDMGIEGNQGLKDQLMGLQWIQDNIEAFGGDPSKVVVFGQSAGAADVAMLGVTENATLLFKAGISESGGGQFIPPLVNASATGMKYAQKAGCSDVACLQALSLEASNITVYTSELSSLTTLGTSSEGYGPNVDGKLLPDQPVKIGVKTPWIFGTTTQEFTAFLSIIGHPTIWTESVYNATVKQLFGTPALALYPYSDYLDHQYPGYDALAQVFSDDVFRCPTYLSLNKASENGVPVWSYLWGQASTCPAYDLEPASAVTLVGAGHGAEAQFVFANVYEPPAGQNCSFTPAEQALSQQFVALWTAMAENGDPGPSWPQYTPDTTLGLVVYENASSGVVGNMDFSKCSFWDAKYTAAGEL